MQTVILTGPQGSGKGLVAHEMARSYGCKANVDEWSPASPLTEGALHITNEPVPAGFRGAEVVRLGGALKSRPIMTEASTGCPTGSMAVAVYLHRGPVGECCATLGIDIQAPGAAPRLEFTGADDGSNNPVSFPLETVLRALGLGKEAFEGCGQCVPVFHEGADLLVAAGLIPGHACDGDGLLHVGSPVVVASEAANVAAVGPACIPSTGDDSQAG